ncbi:hypothetical protein SCHPADRAFT_562284 [Schizopora paradoxa]|uniref:DUF6533 domain-containing protein n=1 Tax=Schizopora paradoxa TaxID=27342 RepID=A0A0H2RDE6_9AGAM|nr:hypothetical protein SCHPADRAFT_562284 [Schizopora paradoxa]
MTSELVDVISDLQKLDLILVGSVCLTTYDLVLSIPSELKLIWRANWTMGKVLYLACRYPTWILLIMCLILQLLTDCSLPCQISVHLQILWVFIGDPGANGNTYICYVSRICSNEMVHYHSVYGASCYLELDATNYPKGAAIGLFAGGAAWEVIIAWILFARLFTAVRQGNSHLAWIILKNGLAYFLIVTTYCTAELLLFIILPDNKLLLPSNISLVLAAITSVLSSRHILHLRAFACQYNVGGGLMTISAYPARSRSIAFANRNSLVADGIGLGDGETVEDIEEPTATISRTGIAV